MGHLRLELAAGRDVGAQQDELAAQRVRHRHVAGGAQLGGGRRCRRRAAPLGLGGAGDSRRPLSCISAALGASISRRRSRRRRLATLQRRLGRRSPPGCAGSLRRGPSRNSACRKSVEEDGDVGVAVWRREPRRARSLRPGRLRTRSPRLGTPRIRPRSLAAAGRLAGAPRRLWTVSCARYITMRVHISLLLARWPRPRGEAVGPTRPAVVATRTAPAAGGAAGAARRAVRL